MQCNGHEVVDLGVMVPTAKILASARETRADVIGLSGLITPSLDEMVFVASEMERQGFDIPLLIGGAMTSKTHTALRIEPAYSGPVVHVLDASRAVGVASALLSATRCEEFAADIRTEYDGIRVARAARAGLDRSIPLEAAWGNRVPIDLTVPVPVPTFTGQRTLASYPLSDLVEYIDWTSFFQTWERSGHYPAILDDPVVGDAARSLFADAQVLRDRIVSEGRFEARASSGFWPANAVDEEIRIYGDRRACPPSRRWSCLRQRMNKASNGRPNFCLADFVAPLASGQLDYIGAFAVTAGHGVNAMVAEFERDHDDYNAILAKALADRLAEAFAERLHARVRREFWGNATNESLTGDDLIRERYQGIRPAPGYPACPDHSQKGVIFSLLQAETEAGMSFTESWSMLPAASVSGWYFWRPEAVYFGVGAQA
jgi:5-methyltetrahydrofolate--homocysteine methyltransferase